MAKSSIKMRAKAAGGVVTIKALMKHPMESGNRKGKDGNKIPEDFIQEITIAVNGNDVLKGRFSGAVSKNPYLSMKAPGNPGDTVKVSWVSSIGKTDSVEEAIK